ncbi:MAG: radical SAM protein [Candidatus Omnitrophica bacterium]|nr:radical SAM protein [Candidatus Omnitrophota bacterium]
MLISWNITKACNLKCEHCYRDAGLAAHDELNLLEGKKLLIELKDLNFRMIIFSGGEPVLREELFQWIPFARESGLISVLGTNGTLIDEECAGRLKQAGLKRLGISIDSVDEKKHDKFRCLDGAWKQAVWGMGNAKKAGIEFQVHTTVTKKNINEILTITDFAQNIGARAHHIFFLVPTGRGNEIDDVIPSAREYERLIEEILQKQKTVTLELKPVCAPQFMRIAKEKNIKTRFEKGCLAGISYACVLPNGEVHPCPYMPINLGNVRDDGGFKKIWQENKVFEDLRSLKLNGKCGICEFKTLCSGCRAAAFHQSAGDYLAEDPNCDYEPKTKTNSENSQNITV